MSLGLPDGVELLGGFNFDVPFIAKQTWTNHTRLLSTEPVSAVLTIAAANVVADSFRSASSPAPKRATKL